MSRESKIPFRNKANISSTYSSTFLSLFYSVRVGLIPSVRVGLFEFRNQSTPVL